MPRRMLLRVAAAELLVAGFAAASVGTASSSIGSLVAFIAIANGSIGCVVAGRWADEWGGLSMILAPPGPLLGALAMRALEKQPVSSSQVPASSSQVPVAS